MSSEKMNNYRALSLFAGIGGFCEGFHLAGFRVTGAVENDKYAAENYRLNFPEVPLFEGSVTDFLPQQKLTRKAHREQFIGPEQLDVVFGGPPCQGYSQIGPRDLADPRNALYKEFCRVVRETSPKFVVIENVPNMFLMNGGHFKQRIFGELKRSGYDNIGWSKLNAADFGVPQERHRIFIVAASSKVFRTPCQDLLDLSVQSLQRPRVTVGDAISDLPGEVAPDSGETLPYDRKAIVPPYQREMRLDKTGGLYPLEAKLARYQLHDAQLSLHNHHTKEIETRRLKLIKLLKPGCKADSLPKSVWDKARPEKWRRLDSEKASHTLLAQMHRDLSEWVHPKHHRWITVREALRIQSFHDGFVLRTSEWQQLKQVGNAVPPLLGYVPAMAVNYGLSMLSGAAEPFQRRGQGNLFL
jgi:DNA (cytosine-5)-methyltransferase 1